MSTPPLWVQRVLTPEQGDSADLRWAIETAAAMWARGDADQALRWLQHAAHTAHGDMRSDRAEAIGRAVMELDRLARQLPHHEITQRDLVPPAAKPSQRSEDSVQSVSRKKTTPYRVAPDDITQLVPPDAKLIEQCEAQSSRKQADTDPEIVPSTPSLPSTESSAGARPRPPPPSVDIEATMSAVTPRRGREPAEHTMVMEIQHRDPDLHEFPVASGPRAPIFESTREYGSPADAPSSARRPASSPTTEGSPHGVLESMRAVRVALEGGSGKRLTIVVLADDEPAPAGSQIALLVPLWHRAGK